MAAKPRKNQIDWKSFWMPYPKADAYRSGFKVSWNYYRALADAEACSKAARNNALIQRELGYDFGYCSPGSIIQVGDEWGAEKSGMWEVCLP